MWAVERDAPSAWGWSPACEFEVAAAPGCGWPLLATPISASVPTPADDRIEQSLRLDAYLARNPESTFLLRVAGDALREAGIHDGDLLVLDRAAPATEGSVVLAVSAGLFRLARIGRDAGGRRIVRAVAPAGDDSLVDTDPALRSVAVVRWAIHRLWPGRLAA